MNRKTFTILGVAVLCLMPILAVAAPHLDRLGARLQAMTGIGAAASAMPGPLAQSH